MATSVIICLVFAATVVANQDINHEAEQDMQIAELKVIW